MPMTPAEERALDQGRMLYMAANDGPGSDDGDARWLVEQGAALNLANGEGVTTLMCACASGHTDLVKAMMESGRDAGLEARDGHGWTALITAAHRAGAELVRVLLQAGADPTAKDKMGRDALYYAKGSRDAEKIKVIEDALNAGRLVTGATVLQQPVTVKKPLQYKP
jgi:ankyrin repeat protein